MSIRRMTFGFRFRETGATHVSTLPVSPAEVGLLSDADLIAAAFDMATQNKDMVVLIGITGGKQ